MADSDENRTIADPSEVQWVAEQRSIVVAYLSAQHCDHAGVSIEPRWFLHPYLAIWAVRSKTSAGLIGWWAISGDVPTDYMTATREIRCSADVLDVFGGRWSKSADAMSRGEYVGIGDPETVTELAPLLAKRAIMLQELAMDERSAENGG